MPYKPFKIENEYCVFKLDANEDKTGSSLGCHPTEQEAYEQIAAIEASEEENTRMNRDEKARSLFEEFWQGLKAMFVTRRIKDVESWDGAAANYSSTEAYCNACLINLNEGDPEDWVQAQCKLPVREDGDSKGTYVRQAVYAAAQRLNQTEASPEELDKARRELVKAYNEMDEEPPESLTRAINRQEDELLQARLEEIRGAFNNQFNNDDSWSNWMIDASDEYVIAEFAGQKYKVPYQTIDGDIIFSSRDEWRQVEIVYNERAMGLDAINEMVYMAAMDKYPMAWFHSIFLDRNGDMFAVLSENAKLYRSPVEINEDKSIMLGDWFEVEQEFVPVQTRTVIRQQADGRYRWVSQSATSVLNRVGEIDSRALFDSFVTHIEETGEYPIRQFYHQGDQFRTGQADFVARDGNVLITSGLYDENNILAQKEIEAIQKESDYWGESIGYKPLGVEMLRANDDIQIPAYTKGILKEISFLPESHAANLFTVIHSMEVNRMLKGKILEAYNKLFGDDEEAAQEFLTRVDETNRSIEDAKMITRDKKEGEATEEAKKPENETEQTEPGEAETQDTEVEIDDNIIEAVVARMQEVENDDITKLRTLAGELSKVADDLTEAVNGLNTAMTEVDNRLKALEKSETDKKREYLEDAPRRPVIQATYKPRNGQTETEEAQKTSSEKVKEMLPPKAY